MVSEKRRMLLYRYDGTGFRTEGTLVTSKNYEFTTLAHERQLADDFAGNYGYCQGDGHIEVVDDKGVTIKQLELQP